LTAKELQIHGGLDRRARHNRERKGGWGLQLQKLFYGRVLRTAAGHPPPTVRESRGQGSAVAKGHGKKDRHRTEKT